MRGSAYRATGFGIVWRADLPLSDFLEVDYPDTRAPLGEVEVRRVGSLAERTLLRAINRGWVYSDGIRFAWNGEVVFDMFEGTHVDYLPETGWRGSLPVSFYSTVAALTVAWRGAVPLHASAVEVAGRAFLVAGPSGAGKSSLAAALIGLGALHVSDDLTIVRVNGASGVDVFPGRLSMRQHAGTAAVLGDAEPIPGDASAKWSVTPSARTSRASLPLGGVLLLGRRSAGDAATDAVLLAANLFRPRWMAALPGYRSMQKKLLEIASAAPMRRFPAIGEFDTGVQMHRATAAMATFAEMAG